MKRALALGFGVAAYLVFAAAFVLLLDFVANVGIVRGIDTGLSAPGPVAVAVDLGLVAAFGVSHSVMARQWFKDGWARIVPRAVERSTYVLVASIVLAFDVWQWRTVPAAVWNVEARPLRIVLWTTSASGVVLVVLSTFLTDHFDFFGLRQVWLYARGKPYTSIPFQTGGLYKYMRHPLMAGILLWLWVTPSMSAGHLLFAIAMSVYVAIGVAFEERDLVRALGEPYRTYRARVRALLPVRR